MKLFLFTAQVLNGSSVNFAWFCLQLPAHPLYINTQQIMDVVVQGQASRKIYTMIQSNDVHDLELYRRLGGDVALVERLIKRFSTSLPILIVRLTLAIKGQDRLRASTQIKMLKEVASALSAQQIFDDLHQLESSLVTAQDCALPTAIKDVEAIAQAFITYMRQRFPGIYETA